MDAGHILSRRLIKATELDQTRTQAGTSFSFSSPSLTANDLPDDPHREDVSRELRSAVERRFMRMNEAHDRIRTEMLGGNSARKR
jgi:hypothetical protein